MSTLSTCWVVSLGLSGALCVGYFIYRLIWHRRHGSFLPAGAVRLGGRVVACDGTELPVQQTEGALHRVVLPAGQRPPPLDVDVTVEGRPLSAPDEERLYRQSPRGCIVARRVVVGRWPDLRWLRIPVGLACLIWLLSLGQLLFGTGPTGRLFQ